MILTLIVTLLIGMFSGLFSVMPTLPAMPDAIVSGTDWFINTIGNIIAVLNWIYTPALLAAIVTVLIAVVSFEAAYFPLMWVAKKIPFLNIK